MSAISCETCKLRAVYDRKPKSILGKIWKWHTSFCPGWKMYLRSVSKQKLQQLYKQYGYRKI